MKTVRMSLEWVIVTATSVAVIYVLCILFALPLAWVWGLYGASVLALVWMVVRILKDPYTMDKTFDEYFYQDREDLRRSGPE